MTFTNVIGSATLVFGVSYATAKGYGIGFTTSDMLWVTLVANIVAVATIPLFGALSDRIGRRSLMIFGGIGGGLLSGVYLWTIEQGNLFAGHPDGHPRAGPAVPDVERHLRDVLPGAVPDAHAGHRVRGVAERRPGDRVALPELFTAIAPPGSTNVPLVIGLVTFGIALVAAAAALLHPGDQGQSLADLEAHNTNAQPLKERPRMK